MKKILFFLFFIIIPLMISAQCHCCYSPKINDRSFLNALGATESINEGFGITYTAHFRKYGSKNFVNPYIGIEINQYSVGITSGIRSKLYEDDCFKTHLISGAVFLYKLKTESIDGYSINEIVNTKKSLVATVSLGPSIEYKRFGLYATINPGIRWDPYVPLAWKKNGGGYVNGEIGVYVLL